MGTPNWEVTLVDPELSEPDYISHQALGLLRIDQEELENVAEEKNIWNRGFIMIETLTCQHLHQQHIRTSWTVGRVQRKDMRTRSFTLSSEE